MRQILALLLSVAAIVQGADAMMSYQRVLEVPYPDQWPAAQPRITVVENQELAPCKNASCVGTSLNINATPFERGIGAHAHSRLRVESPKPMTQFTAQVGVDNNPKSPGALGSVRFSVEAEGEVVAESGVVTGADDPIRLQAHLGGTTSFELVVDDAGDGIAYDHADWADAAVTFEGGETLPLDEFALGPPPRSETRYPFSFTYGGRSSDALLGTWRREEKDLPAEEGATRRQTTWTCPETGLRVHWLAAAYEGFPAVEWLLRFENAGPADTAIIEDVQALDLTICDPKSGAAPYRLHSLRGGTYDPQQFEPYVDDIAGGASHILQAGAGRGSTAHTPFFKLETGQGAIVGAIGWSGAWQAGFACSADGRLRVQAGLELTSFKLHPGENVRSPRAVLLFWEGDRQEANAQFRQLLYRHYVARRNGEQPLPILFCNTCFTRGGGWLNETTAENQISLINAYAPLGLEALLTDAGWFEGGWPNGAGNWTPRADAYPEGMAPVAQAAKDRGMVYGLWFEPERVMKGTWLHENRPEWLLGWGGNDATFLLNFGLPEVRDYFFNIVKDYMELPGFAIYRQDFNMDPLPYWRANDADDRQGVTEMKYVEGLYAYWDRIRERWPKCLMEECASGGHRIDIETLMRMHIHQKTDYWFDDEVNQAALWSLSQYLPNNSVVCQLRELDDYSFHSCLASSMGVGWIADAKDFDNARGKEILDAYHKVRHILTGAWYPIMGYSRDSERWLASQYHRPDLEEGLILAFRRGESPYRAIDARLRGLDPEATYELSYADGEGRNTLRGAEMMSGFELELEKQRQSALIVYKRVK